MARYEYTQDCDLRLIDFYKGANINKPIFTIGEIDNISTINGATLIFDKMCDNDDTTNSIVLEVCANPSATFEVTACVANGIDANHIDLSYAFGASSSSAITGESWSYDLIKEESGTISIVNTVLTSSSGTITLEDSAIDITVRMNYTFTTCNTTYTFAHEFQIPAGASATCPLITVNPMTITSQTSTGPYYREGDDLVIVLSGYGSHSLVKVDVQLVYSDGFSLGLTLTIPYCVYVDCDNTMRCRVSSYVWETKDYYAMAMYEALQNVTRCQDLDCTNACSILDVLTDRINAHECSC